MASNRIDSSDELVESVGLYVPRPLLFHGYVFPFIILYAVWAWFFLFVYGWSDYFEPALIMLVGTGILQVLTCLFCHWTVHVQAALTCIKEEDISKATVVKVVPLPNNGSPELVPLQKHQDGKGTICVWFEFQKSKYIWDGEERKQFRALEFPVARTFKEYIDSRGLNTAEKLTQARQLYGANSLVMDIPSFGQLFKERATAPFFVFQMFCVGLWCLDDYWYYSVFTLFMLITFECTMVFQQMRNMTHIRSMGNKPTEIYVYRSNKWIKSTSDDLIPGDLISLSKGASRQGTPTDTIVPCDVVLLRGSAVVDESMLTGESVPQMKEGVDGADSPTRPLDMAVDGKLHVLYGGTKLVQQGAVKSTHLRAPDGGVLCSVLRNGFSSSQGRLLRTILYSVSRITANNLEAFIFILFLLIFAVAAAGYVWVKGTEDPDRNRYKLFLECTLILTSVIPPELPIELSLAVNNSLLSLTKLYIFCTEPFRIPFAGKVDICCFDKTGTLTSDDLVVEGVAGLDGTSAVVAASDAPNATIQVVASCHSLVSLDDALVGDPQEKAAMTAIDWKLGKSNTVLPKRCKMAAIKVSQRFHFSSGLKRMSVVASHAVQGSPEFSYFACVKGAPEMIRGMLANIPENYDSVHLALARRGARVLALARKDFGTFPSAMNEQSRGKVECNLEFAGFLVFSCPLKRDSLKVIKELQHSSHATVMITGDNPLTACNVAEQLGITKRVTLILQPQDDDVEVWHWRDVHHTLQLPLVPTEANVKKLTRQYDFCLTGDAITYLRSLPEFLPHLLPRVTVFARVAPKQKEFVITQYKALGLGTLMCGDGTNDVGALKHAHVGVAIISSGPLSVEAGRKAEERRVDKQRKIMQLARTDRSMAPTTANGRALTPQQQKAQKAMEDMKKLLAEMDEEQNIVKLGDASIASPFTSRLSSIKCVVHIIKQGRCTLVTTLQMFKILALNSLILAYSQSVLYLDGIKFSDYQATLQGLLLAMCFLFVSRCKPVATLSRQRPLTNIFNAYTLLTVLLQFTVHFSCLYTLVNAAKVLEPKLPKVPSAAAVANDTIVANDTMVNGTETEGGAEDDPLLAKFAPSLLNSTVYMISMTLQISTFAINYRGLPYMQSMRDNTALFFSLFAAGSFVFSLAAGLLPEVAEQFEIVVFPDEFRGFLLQVLLLDMSLSFVADRVLLWLCGEGSVATALRR